MRNRLGVKPALALVITAALAGALFPRASAGAVASSGRGHVRPAAATGGDFALSSPKGCVTAQGTCYVGAYQYGWETLHADYWQTWQEASNNNNLDSKGGFDLTGDAGTFGDLVEDCADEGTTACSFITNTTPTLVYGSGSGAP